MTLNNHLVKYYPVKIKRYNWIKGPFTEKTLVNFTTTKEEQLIDYKDYSMGLLFEL